MKRSIFLFNALLTFSIASANVDSTTVEITKTDSSNLKYADFQISFVAPISTNGLEGKQYVNNFSFNILSGYSAGMNGFELAGLANLESEFINGFQVAGITNIVGGDSKGGQLSGFSNIVRGSFYGAQVAGFNNYVDGDVDGMQVAGFANMSRKAVRGAQIAGFSNTSMDSSNVTQIAGFANMNKGDLIGFQIAGFSNVTTGDLVGGQISGFINVANNVTGTQIGFINLSDSISGVPVGFLSISKKGYRKLELWGSEALHANIAFKTGARQFYNILIAGATSSNNEFKWGFGYGIGTQVLLSRSMDVSVDLTSTQISEDLLWDGSLNLLNQLRVTLGKTFNNKVSLFAGPTYNIMISSYERKASEKIGSTIAPWSHFDETYRRYNGWYNRTNVKMWVGVNAGIRF